MPKLGLQAGHAAYTSHSTAMDLLQHGVDPAVIALWGHENVETTQIYIHADMRMKEKALARVAAPATPSGRFRPDDQLLAFQGSDYAELPHGQCRENQLLAEAMRHNPDHGIMPEFMKSGPVPIDRLEIGHRRRNHHESPVVL